jgi:hypothetical protein
MDELIEDLEMIQSRCEFALGAPWTADKLKEMIAAIKADLRHCVEQAYDLNLLRDVSHAVAYGDADRAAAEGGASRVSA